MYHRFSGNEEFGKTSRQTFEEHLSYLSRHYKIIRLTDAVERFQRGTKLPNRSVVITIDDGYKDFYEIAFPVLQKFNVPATIYLVTDFVNENCWIWTDKARYVLCRTKMERLDIEICGTKFDQALGGPDSRLILAGALNTELKRLSDEDKDARIAGLAKALKVDIPDRPTEGYRAFGWDDARKMAAAGIEVGSHTATHPILTNVASSRLESELRIAKSAIEGNLEKSAAHFCYPNGNASKRERDAADAAGYASAVTTEIRLCENGDDRFMLPRIDAEPEIHRFVQSTSGFDRLKG